MIANTVFFIAFVASLATLVSSNESFMSPADIKETFFNDMKHIFWSNKVKADQLMQSGRELEGKELLNMAQAAGFIEAVKYAIRHKSLSSVRDAISSRFENHGLYLYDRQSMNNMRSELLPVLLSRVLLRSFIDSDRFTAPYWRWLFKLTEHNLAAYPSNKHFTLLAVDAYKRKLQLNTDIQSAQREFDQILKTSLKALDIDELQSRHIVDLVDGMIEEMLACQTCREASPYPAPFNTKPMFDGQSGVQKALAERLDPQLDAAYGKLEGVYNPSLEEQERVNESDIKQLMQRLIVGL